MARLNLNLLLRWLAIIIIVAIAAVSNYRLEIGASGLKFERNMIDGFSP